MRKLHAHHLVDICFIRAVGKKDIACCSKRRREVQAACCLCTTFVARSNYIAGYPNASIQLSREEILYRMARFSVFACTFVAIRNIFLFIAVLVRGVYLFPIAIVCIAPFPIFIGGLIIFILVIAVLVGVRILAACRPLVT